MNNKRPIVNNLFLFTFTIIVEVKNKSGFYGKFCQTNPQITYYLFAH